MATTHLEVAEDPPQLKNYSVEKEGGRRLYWCGPTPKLKIPVGPEALAAQGREYLP